MKILVWQTAYLGDVVLTTPLIRTIKKNLPTAHVAFVGRSFIRELLKGYDIELITFDKSLSESLKILQRIEDFQVAISPHISARSALMLFMAKIPVRIGFDRSELSWLYTHLLKHHWEKHEVERNLELLKPLGIRKYERMPHLYIYKEERERVKRDFGLPEEFIVFSPFSNFPLKEWHLRGWIELSKRVSMPVVIVGTKRDLERSKVFNGTKVINLVGKTSLRELMAVISLSRVVVSCDSSPVHIANALNVPALSLYTSTSPRYGFYPLKGSYLVPDIPCSPCSPNPKKCKTGSQACLTGISVEEVLEKLTDLLSV